VPYRSLSPHGQIIDLEIQDGEDHAFAAAVHDAWLSPDSPITRLEIGEQAVVLASEVVGYRRHGSVLPDSRGPRYWETVLSLAHIAYQDA
jgi:hypothetical protein